MNLGGYVVCFKNYERGTLCKFFKIFEISKAVSIDKYQSLMDDTCVAQLALDILIQLVEVFPTRNKDGFVIRPMPLVKRHISEPTILPHLVQLLLTFDPPLVERVAKLLHIVMDDNPLCSRLYLTGVFYFILMYTGSNVLPITRFLKATHLKQAFKADSENIMMRSILSTALPEAMVHYLDNYTEEKFSEIYLGEFDTPEAIWNSEMRRMMIEKLAGHIADFTPRLHSNTRAIYQFVPLPKLEYPQLENELFVHIYWTTTI